MATPPRLTYDGENRPKVKASLSGGRFHFTLRQRAKGLLLETLSYERGEEVPWQLFKLLVLAGDANFPNVQDPVELGEDLVEPSSHREPTEREARSLATHLEETQLDDRQVSALATELTAAGLDSHVDFEKLGGEADEVDAVSESRETAGEGADAAAESTSGGESADEVDASPVEVDASPTETKASATEEGVEFDVGPLVEAMTRLGERLAESEERTLDAMSTSDLVDLYSLLSTVKQESDDLRTDARDVLVERLADGERVDGAAGAVACSTRRRRSLKPEPEVFARLSEAGVDQTEVMSVQLDREKLVEIAADRAIPESDLFDVSETRYVRRVSD